jgi:hypothetical protein
MGRERARIEEVHHGPFRGRSRKKSGRGRGSRARRFQVRRVRSGFYTVDRKVFPRARVLVSRIAELGRALRKRRAERRFR